MKKGISRKIYIARNELEMSQDMLAKRIGVSRVQIANWEIEKYIPGKKNIEKLAKALNKPVAYFFEEEVNHGALRDFANQDTSNFLRIPLLGEVTAGFPEYDNSQVEGYIEIPRCIFPGADFVVKCCGDSLEPDIMKGDLCVVRKTTDILNNKIMIVKILGGGFTMKRIIKKDGVVELHSSNHKYETIHPKELRIVGQVLGVWKKL